MRARFLALLLFIPLLLLGGWLLSDQLPTLLSPQWWWVSATNPNGAPAACEAAASLNAYQGQRVIFQQPAISAEAAKAAGDRLFAETYAPSDDNTALLPPVEYGGPSLFSAVFEGERRLVWLYTARLTASHVANLPGSEMPGAAAIVYLDATTNESLALLSAVGAGDAPAMCPFPLRDWAVVALRSTPFIAFAVYAGALVGISIVLSTFRFVRKRRAK